MGWSPIQGNNRTNLFIRNATMNKEYEMDYDANIIFIGNTNTKNNNGYKTSTMALIDLM